MKKIILTLITILMLATQSKAVTLKITQNEGTVTMTRPSGSEVRLKDSTNQIRWWKVKSGGIEIIDNKFIMPENDVEIEPQYTGYLITVKQTENGTISPGTVGVEDNSSQTFTITPDPGYEISEVIIDGTTNLGKISEYEFSEINSNHVITANYIEREKKKLTIEQQNGTIIQEEIAMGKIITLTAEDNEIFTKWESDDIEINNPTNRTIQITMPEKDARIVAKGGKTINKLTISEDGINKIEENKTIGEEITITADTSGDYFLYWRISGIEIENKTDPTISFTMPPNDVTAIPVYKDRRLVELTVGIFDGETNPHFTRSELYGKEITLTAPEQEGATFVKWEVKGIEISDTTQKTITFRMPTTKVRATAIYEKTSEEE